MFDTIILLTGATEWSVLGDVLRRDNSRLAVRPVSSAKELASLGPALLRRARLIGFATDVVVPAQTLAALRYGAYNFHPGPPHYPGRTPAHFAIYDRAKKFGSTAHVMVERVDAGPIVGVELFVIPPETDLTALSELSYSSLARLFWRLAPALATRPEPLPVLPVQWSGRKSTTRLYASVCDIPVSIAKDDLDRRIAAFGGGHFGINPAVTLHGHRFAYVKATPPVDTEAPSIVPEELVVEAAE